MTAPTPEQMRALANNADWRAEKLDHAEDRRAVRQYEAALRSAADEVDRLRAAESRAYAERAQALLSLGKQIEATAHLRAVIENAPHADDCCIEDVTWVPGWEGAPTPLRGHCNCWKADTL